MLSFFYQARIWTCWMPTLIFYHNTSGIAHQHFHFFTVFIEIKSYLTQLGKWSDACTADCMLSYLLPHLRRLFNSRNDISKSRRSILIGSTLKILFLSGNMQLLKRTKWLYQWIIMSNNCCYDSAIGLLRCFETNCVQFSLIICLNYMCINKVSANCKKRYQVSVWFS